MDRAAKRAVKRKQAELMNKRAQITVKDQWNGDGTVTRTVSIDESNPTDAQLLMQMLSIKPPEADDAAQQEQAVAPVQAEEAEQAPATQVDDQTGDQKLRTETGKKKSKIAVETLMDRVQSTGRDFSALDNQELQQLFDDADQNGISQEERAEIYNELCARGIHVFGFKRKADHLEPGDRFETVGDSEFTSENIVPAGTQGTVVRERPDILEKAIAVTFDGMEDYGELVILNDTWKIKKIAMKKKANSILDVGEEAREWVRNQVIDNNLHRDVTFELEREVASRFDLSPQDAHDVVYQGWPDSQVGMKKKAGSSQYLQTFFEEKNLPYASWELTDNEGTMHSIDNEVVIEAIMGAPENEQAGIADMIRKIDFANGDVNDYLKHLAQGLINGGRAAMTKKADETFEVGDSVEFVAGYQKGMTGQVYGLEDEPEGEGREWTRGVKVHMDYERPGDQLGGWVIVLPMNLKKIALKKQAVVDMDGNELSRGDTVVSMGGSAPGVAKGKILSLPYNQSGTAMVHVLTEDYDPQTGWQEEDWNSAMVRKTAGRVKIAKVFELTQDQVEVDTWFERDRQHVELRDKETGETIMDWWDEAVSEAVEDGFLNPRDWEGSAYEYAKQMGMIKEPEPIFE